MVRRLLMTVGALVGLFFVVLPAIRLVLWRKTEAVSRTRPAELEAAPCLT
jgi:hypothetical protein